MWFNILQKIVKFLDPTLDKYRDKASRLSRKPSHRSQSPAPRPAPYTPSSIEDFIGVIRRTPATIISRKDRARISAIMSFDDRIIADLMTPRSRMVFVKSSEVLGPLVLDKLYQSGFTHFPVVDTKEKVIGILHTEALNHLEVRTTNRAEEYLDPTVHYLHSIDPLSIAAERIKETGSTYFLVRDTDERLVGSFTTADLINYLLGE